MHAIIIARLWLETNISPAAPWVILTFGIWFGAWLTRRYLPKVWDYMANLGPENETAAHVWQALPSLLAGALFEASTTGDYATAWRGALVGAGAPLWHHLMKKSPIPYTGALNFALKNDPTDKETEK